MPRRRVPINKDVLRARVSYIEDSRGSLERFRGTSYEEFHSNPDHFRIAFYDLHRSLEAIMKGWGHPFKRLAILQFMQKIVGGSYIALLVDRSVMDMDHGKRTKVR